MSYKVIIDSCGELTEEMKKSGHFTRLFEKNVGVKPAVYRKLYG